MKMAQALFEAIAAGLVGMDSQTAMAVQSLLESQNITIEAPSAVTTATAVVEEEDVFQCGKCKKQFNSLQNFLNHKQVACSPVAVPPAKKEVVVTVDPNALNPLVNNALNRQAQPQQTISYNNITSASLAQQLSQGSMVLTDDLMAFAAIDQTIQTPTLQVATSNLGNPFLPQGGGPPTPKSSNGNTIFTSIAGGNIGATTVASSYNGAAANGSIQVIQPVQTITVATTQPEPKVASNIVIKPAAPQGTTDDLVKTVTTKKVPNTNVITVIADLEQPQQQLPPQQIITKPRRTKTNAISTGMTEENTKKKLKCQYCDRSFTKNFDLQQHIRSHTGERPFQCIVCGRAFAQKSNVKKHMQTHKVWPSGNGRTLPPQPEPEVIAVTGSQSAVPPAPIEKEVIQEDPDEGKASHVKHIYIDNSYVCHYCNEKFKTYFQLKSHMTIHKSEQVYKCILKTCSTTFADLDSFLEHTKTHENEMQYRCHMCNKQFGSLYSLGVHQYSHSLYPNQGPKPGPRYFRCIKCNNKYATPEALDHHMQTVSHNFPCPHCDKTFSCERYLRRHLPIHGTTGEYECEVCGKAFKTEHYLKLHVLIHSGEKPYQCDQCDAAFNRKDKLKRHATIHDPVKKYKCPFRNHTGCTKAFNRPDKLKAHIIVHSGIKPYSCKECGKPFSRRPHLLEHERTHKSEYKFRCDVCGRGFHRQKLFATHKCKTTNKNIGETKQKKMFETRNKKKKVGRPKGSKQVSHIEESVKSAFQKSYPFKKSTRTRFLNKNHRKPQETEKVIEEPKEVNEPITIEPLAPVAETTDNLTPALVGTTDSEGRVVMGHIGHIYVQNFDGTTQAVAVPQGSQLGALQAATLMEGETVTMAMTNDQDYTGDDGVDRPGEGISCELQEVAINMNYDTTGALVNTSSSLGATLITTTNNGTAILVSPESASLIGGQGAGVVSVQGDQETAFHFQATAQGIQGAEEYGEGQGILGDEQITPIAIDE